MNYFPQMKPGKEVLIKRNDNAMVETVMILDDSGKVSFISSIKPYAESIARGYFIQWLKRADGQTDILNRLIAQVIG